MDSRSAPGGRNAQPGGGPLAIETSNLQIGDLSNAPAEVPPGQYVLMSVIDAGTGMPPETVDHVFEPFFTTKGVGEGSGLGLSMEYGFVMQSGGHIRIRSEEDSGTTISIYLPRFLGPETEDTEPETPHEIPKARNKSVLVVEDDQVLRRLVVRMLESLNYEVQAAGTGKAALELLDSMAEFDVLVTDVVLSGGMSGYDLGKAAARLDDSHGVHVRLRARRCARSRPHRPGLTVSARALSCERACSGN